MLLVFDQREGIDEKGKRVFARVSISPDDVATVERARFENYSVVTLRDRREILIVGTVEEITERINAALRIGDK